MEGVWYDGNILIVNEGARRKNRFHIGAPRCIDVSKSHRRICCKYDGFLFLCLLLSLISASSWSSGLSVREWLWKYTLLADFNRN